MVPHFLSNYAKVPLPNPKMPLPDPCYNNFYFDIDKFYFGRKFRHSILFFYIFAYTFTICVDKLQDDATGSMEIRSDPVNLTFKIGI